MPQYNFNGDLAKETGVEGAVLLNYLSQVVLDGYKEINAREIKDLFPFWSLPDIKKVIASIPESVLTVEYNEDEYFGIYIPERVRAICAYRAPSDGLVFKSKAKGVTENFQVLWKAYPKKVNKTHAIRAWRKIKPEPDDVLLAQMLYAIEKQQLRKMDSDYIPYLSTWLNQRKWET